MIQLTSPFNLKDRVIIDGQKDLVGSVTEISYRHDGMVVYVIYQVEWLNNGINQAAYIAGWRLTPA